MTYSEAVKDFIRFCNSQLPVFKKYGSGWYGIDRCTKCGKHKKRVNMYISFPDEYEPDRNIFVKCFRASCGYAGRISLSDLEAIGYDNKEAIKVILEHKGGKSYAKLPRIGEEILINTKYKEDIDVFNYFKSRTGVVLNEDKCKEYRILTDYNELIKNNPFIPESCVRALNGIITKKNLICMLTDNAKRLIVRSIKGSFKCILPLIEGDNTDYYMLRRSSEIKDIVVSEGAFDIINFANMNRSLENALFIASLGLGATYDVVNYETLDYDKLERLIFVADSSVDKYGKYTADIEFYRRLAKRFNDKFKEIYVVYNSMSKDFGDLKEPIVPEKVRLK